MVMTDFLGCCIRITGTHQISKSIIFNRKVYDLKIVSLPLADSTESTTPVFCDVCMKNNERSKAQSYCTDCRKCLCTKQVQVWMCYLPNKKFLPATLSMSPQFGILEPQTMSM